MDDIDISNHNKADVLAALYNRSGPLGLGALHFDSSNMTPEDAQKILDGGRTYFDYLKGRVMKVELGEDRFNPALYDRDNGPGAAAEAIRSI